MLGRQDFYLETKTRAVVALQGVTEYMVHSRKLTAGYIGPKMMVALEKGDGPLKMAIFGIYVRFLGCKLFYVGEKWIQQKLFCSKQQAVERFNTSERVFFLFSSWRIFQIRPSQNFGFQFLHLYIYFSFTSKSTKYVFRMNISYENVCNYLFLECQYECVKSTCHMEVGTSSATFIKRCAACNGSGGGPRVVRGNRGGDVQFMAGQPTPPNLPGSEIKV